jgi:hypothetical protein
MFQLSLRSRCTATLAGLLVLIHAAWPLRVVCHERVVTNIGGAQLYER